MQGKNKRKFGQLFEQPHRIQATFNTNGENERVENAEQRLSKAPRDTRFGTNQDGLCNSNEAKSSKESPAGFHHISGPSQSVPRHLVQAFVKNIEQCLQQFPDPTIPPNGSCREAAGQSQQSEGKLKAQSEWLTFWKLLNWDDLDDSSGPLPSHLEDQCINNLFANNALPGGPSLELQTTPVNLPTLPVLGVKENTTTVQGNWTPPQVNCLVCGQSFRQAPSEANMLCDDCSSFVD